MEFKKICSEFKIRLEKNEEHMEQTKKNSNTEQYIASETCGTPSSMPPYTYCEFQKEKREKREQKKVFKDING